MRAMRSFEVFCRFQEAAATGKKCIMFGPNYVAMDNKSYDALLAGQKGDPEPVWYDEMASVKEKI